MARRHEIPWKLCKLAGKKPNKLLAAGMCSKYAVTHRWNMREFIRRLYLHFFNILLTRKFSTACVAVLKDDTVYMANLGDSGMLVVRPPNSVSTDWLALASWRIFCVLDELVANLLPHITQVVFRSEEQQHGFNFPYQLGSQSRDKPLNADVKQYVHNTNSTALNVTFWSFV